MAQVVMDANMGVALVINLLYSDLTEERSTLWRETQDQILVPDLWKNEVVSALRKAVSTNLISPSEIMTALEELFRLGVQEAEASIETHRLAVSWAARLNQVVAYNSQYLALAEQSGAEFWTTKTPGSRCSEKEIKLGQMAWGEMEEWILDESRSPRVIAGVPLHRRHGRSLPFRLLSRAQAVEIGIDGLTLNLHFDWTG